MAWTPRSEPLCISAPALLQVCQRVGNCGLQCSMRQVLLHAEVLSMLLRRWCPTQDKFLDLKYDEETVAEGKAFAKETLQVMAISWVLQKCHAAAAQAH